MARWQSCNVLDATGENRQLWQFVPAGEALKQTLEAKTLPSEPLPARPIAKDWQTLYRRKLNVAWLPPDKVFLRALQIPCNDAAEAKSMVELQIEKLSPLPVNQIVWSFELLPGVLGPLRTALAVIAERAFVEEFLGKLEGQGYLADRLEIPFIDELLATRTPGDGVHIHPIGGPDPQVCLAAWFYNGLLQSVSLVRLPPGADRAPALSSHLHQVAWAGEAEGWLTSPPRCHLVADEPAAAEWKPLLADIFEAPVQGRAPTADAKLAALTARRATSTEPQGDLLPPEYLARYRQQLIDRIWMRGLGAGLVLYLLAALLYFAAIQFVQFQRDQLDTQLRQVSLPYTNAVRLKAQVQVLQEQLDLQFAALECYKAVATLLPETLTLDGFNFNRGKSLTLFGSAPQDASAQVGDFNEAMAKATDQKEQPLFIRVNPPTLTTRGQLLNWNFLCELKPTEGE